MNTGADPAGMLIQLSSREDLSLISDKFKEIGKTNAEFLPLITALTVLAETGDVETITEVIDLIIDLRAQIVSSSEEDKAQYPINKAGWD